MFIVISSCFCLASMILILSPFWLIKNETIKTDALSQELEHLKALKQETLNIWMVDEKRYQENKSTEEEWEKRKLDLKNRYIALSRQEIIYKDAVCWNL